MWVNFFGCKIFSGNFQSKREQRIPTDSVRVSKKLRWNVQDIFYFQTIFLTLTRPIGLPPHAPVAQKIAFQR